MTDTLSVPTQRVPTHRVSTTRVPTHPIAPHRLPGPRSTASRSVAAPRASRPARGVVVDDREVAPTWMRSVGAACLIGGIALVATVLGWPGDAPETSLVVPGLVAVVVGVLLLVARAGYTVTDTHVVLHFRPLPARRVRRDRITDVRIVEADASTYGGIGLRVGHGVRALILTPGVGIEFTDDRGRTTFVRTERPEAAVRALR